jgi:hypothetical protein
MEPGSEPTAQSVTRRRAWTDAALYAGSALFAWLVIASSDLPLQRAWGRVAVWSYAGGAALALLLAAAPRRPRFRTTLAIAVMIGATVVPLLTAAAGRGGDEPGAGAQSEVFIVEDGASALLEGRDPYAVRFGGPLASRPLPTRTHVPYPPGMLLFGLPKATAGAGVATDARVWFLLVSLGVAVPALRTMRTDANGRLRSFQILFVLPTGSALLATGGHDVPVLAVLLAASVLADRQRFDGSGAVSGLALSLRQTSLLAIPFLVSVVPRGRRARSLAWTAIPILAIVVPFLLWDPGAFVEDTILFPLGLGTGPSSARTPTLGALLIGLWPGARTPITIGLIVALVVSVAVLLRWRPSTTAAGASARAAVAFAIAIALAPAARFGYVVYPISLAAWSLAFRAGRPVAPEGRATRETDRSTEALDP